MLTVLDCLMVKVMRAKNFHDGNFLNSQLGGSPSMIWRSIWESKQLLLKGCRVWVGNGKEINVWNSPWLPCLDNGLVTTDKREVLPNLTVADLMEENFKAWDVCKIASIFNDRDRKLIVYIPLSV